MTSGQTVASLFFANVFGKGHGVKVFNLLIALSVSKVKVQILCTPLCAVQNMSGTPSWVTFAIICTLAVQNGVSDLHYRH